MRAVPIDGKAIAAEVAAEDGRDGRADDHPAVRDADHHLRVRPLSLVLSRAWVQCLFIALLVVAPVFGIIYGILLLGMDIDITGSAGGTAGRLYLLTLLVSFLAVWAATGLPAAIRAMKADLVKAERGKGAWKLVDESDWDDFTRLYESKLKQAKADRAKSFEL